MSKTKTKTKTPAGISVSAVQKSELRSLPIDSARLGVLGTSQLLTAFLNSPVIGFAILDKELRFEATNKALAAILRTSAEAYLGKTIQETLGSTAVPLELLLRRIFFDTRTIPSFEFTGIVPIDRIPAHWTQVAFPIRDASGAVTRVGMIVAQGTTPGLETTITADAPKMLRRSTEHNPDSVVAINRAQLRSSLFRGLDDNAFDLIVEAAEPVHRARGEFFCKQDERATRVYLLTSGQARVSGSTRAGKEVLIDWMRVGDVVGVGALVPVPFPYCWTVRAVADSSALGWDHSKIRNFAASWPSLFENGLRIALQWVLQLQERLETVATEMVEPRLAQTILRMLPVAGENELQVSDEELALMIGSNLFAVNRIINRWQKRGCVQKTRKRLLILSREDLLRIAEHRSDERSPSHKQLPLKNRA